MKRLRLIICLTWVVTYSCMAQNKVEVKNLHHNGYVIDRYGDVYNKSKIDRLGKGTNDIDFDSHDRNSNWDVIDQCVLSHFSQEKIQKLGLKVLGVILYIKRNGEIDAVKFMFPNKFDFDSSGIQPEELEAIEAEIIKRQSEIKIHIKFNDDGSYCKITHAVRFTKYYKIN